MAQPGQYSFPFSYQLPDWLPSTFVYYGCGRAEAKIEYKIRVVMKHQDSIVRKEPKHKHPCKEIEACRTLIVRKPGQILI
jgi:hypothetical protein